RSRIAGRTVLRRTGAKRRNGEGCKQTMINPLRSLRLCCAGMTIALAMTASCAHRSDTGSNVPSVESNSDAAKAGAPRIRLFWRTETEDNAYGFFVYRADEPGAESVCINADHPLPAAGNSTAPQEYVFYDLDVDGDRSYYYRLQQVDLD